MLATGLPSVYVRARMGFRLAGTPGPTGVPAWFLRSWRVCSLPGCCHLHLQTEVKIKYFAELLLRWLPYLSLVPSSCSATPRRTCWGSWSYADTSPTSPALYPASTWG